MITDKYPVERYIKCVYYLHIRPYKTFSKLYYALKSLPAVLSNDVIVPWLMLDCSKSLQNIITGTIIQTGKQRPAQVRPRLFSRCLPYYFIYLVLGQTSDSFLFNDSSFAKPMKEFGIFFCLYSHLVSNHSTTQ